MAALLTYLGVVSAGVLVPYLLAFHVVSGQWSAVGAARWAMMHSPDSAFSFQFGRDVVLSLRSWCQVIFSGRPGIVQYRNPLTIALLGAAAWVLLAFGRELARRIGDERLSVAVRNLWAYRFAAMWVSAYAVFLFVWLPQNTFYKLFALPGLCLLAASCRKPDKRVTASSPIALFVILMAICNLTFAIIPYSGRRANEAVDFALRLGERLEPGAVVYFHRFSADDWLARYFSPRTSWRRADSTGAIDADLRQGRAVWLETSAADDLRESDPAWLEARTDGSKPIALINSKHRIAFTRLRPAGR